MNRPSMTKQRKSLTTVIANSSSSASLNSLAVLPVSLFGCPLKKVSNSEPRLTVLVSMILVTVLLFISTSSYAQDPPPPEPSSSSQLNEEVTNPITGLTTTVTGLIADPPGTPTDGATAFVQTLDGYVFLVKGIGELVYNSDDPPVAFEIIGAATTVDGFILDPVEDFEGAPPDATNEVARIQTQAEFDMNFNSTPPAPEEPEEFANASAAGVRITGSGGGGSNGRAGALFVPPTEGGTGGRGPDLTYPDVSPASNPVPSTSVDVPNAANEIDRIGILVGSRGGNGGNGGASILSFWSGQAGGNSGAGGTVRVTHADGFQVRTAGDGGHGIFAYSRSGEAGDGGDGILAPSGGSGGTAGPGGDVFVTNNGSIVTNGQRAYGIYALSQSNNGGGGGGQWGIVGGPGGGYPGGDGGDISVTNNGSIETNGQFSHGILSLSVGGTGGSSGDSGNLLLDLPGDAQPGGDGGVVTATNNGLIETNASFARGIFAQSIGGGGGNGGFGGGLISLGGSAAGGGDSSTVTVTNSATGIIRTNGQQSDAIFAQSVGGSSGSGSSTAGLIAIGGNGSAAGDGGDVVVRNFGAIEAEGELARGIVAQSIGGGGGDGGNSGGLASVGGRGSGAGNGGAIEVTNTGSISTVGDGARGVFAQSVGGGGGSGGNTGGLVTVGGTGSGGGVGNTVTVTQGGTISTAGQDADAVFVQSVGGGGGNGGSAGSVSAFVGVAVGGNGGGGGAGGEVNVTLQGQDANNASIIRTGVGRSEADPENGDRSSGVFAQSVGGGGGNGGGSVQVTGGAFGGVSIAVGGDGGIAGAGGDVTADSGGGVSIIETAGNDATGAFFQSVGGGGGNGGYAVSVGAAVGPGAGALSVGVGGRSNAGGAGGVVEIGEFDVNDELLDPGFRGSIITSGDRSTGLVAQSVGGGGGNGGIAVSASASVGVVGGVGVAVGIGGDGGVGGAGGKVSVGTEGNVTTAGDFSSGMLVQSVGGGGGNGGGSIAASLAGGGGVGAGIAVSLGSEGGSGNAGGDVTLATRSGTVSTRGESSSGITAQSVGGGGGNGGYSVAVGVGGSGVAAGAVTVGLGGDGGEGGFGGIVNADLESNVLTEGTNSSGIVVQSVGGGGGNGGFNVSAGGAIGATGAGTVGVGIGGGGNAGGAGGVVNVTSSGVITTRGANSSGFVAQSIGGGGGNGGFNVSGTIAVGGTGSGAVSVGLGGAGAEGSAADNVTAETTGDVRTEGESSTAILAQSVGGGGGNGAFNVSVALSGAGTGSGAVGVGLGGSGGGGGGSGEVDLTVQNNVTTLSDDSNAVVAQSIGGGGGNGAFNVNVSGTGAGTGSLGVGVGIGGNGAGAGNAALVVSDVTGDVVTQGSRSNGLVVQSVGGGGGNGGVNVSANLSVAGTASAGVGVGIGGGGDGGGNGGVVDSTLTGSVVTMSDSSSGVVAQSLGGGGGNGAVNVTGTVTGAGSGAGGVSVGLGGTGGGGGNALRVDSGVTGSVTTMGNESTGILAQSLGGGGGNGGVNVSAAISGSSSGAGALSVGLGGSGGDGGDAFIVDSDVFGDVVTMGTNSAGVVAQSLGGGGGNGAVNVTGNVALAGTGAGNVGVGIGGAGGDGGTGGQVLADVLGNISTAEAGSGGFLAQSLGGGGGNGGVNVTGGLTVTGSGATVGVGVGGLGGDGGESGDVTATLMGDVAAAGDDSYGVLTQSIGGGGGNGGVNVTAGVTMSQAAGGTLAVGVGGFGGNASDGGIVTSTVDGIVSTNGASAFGVRAQSVGGGGGNGGVNVAGALNMTLQQSGAIAGGVGGFGGDGGAGQMVTLTRTGLTSTAGANADGVVAQSIGGGGGQGGLNVSAGIAGSTQGAALAGAFGLGGFGGDGGAAGDVMATVTGSVLAPGFASDNTEVIDGIERRVIDGGSNAVLAQSVGGSGGNGGVNVSGGIALTAPSAASSGSALTLGIGGFGGGAGDAGIVTLDVTSDVVVAFGDDRSAVAAQSIGGGGGNGGINVSGGVVLDGALTVGVGGSGGGGGLGRMVTSTVDAANVSASGRGSRGVLAQSVGGGGGNGGINVSGGVSLGNAGQTSVPSLVFGMGGEGGDGNLSGNVTATQIGNITVDGVDSMGVLVQSIAGGGGSGGLNVSGGLNAGEGFAAVAGVGGTGGLGADAGSATLTSNGAIEVTGTALAAIGDADEGFTRFGDRANGILVQSVGGGGGQGGANVSGLITRGSAVTVGVGGTGGGGGDAGVVTVTRGDVAAMLLQTRGDQANGITAQSIGGGGGDAGMNLQFALSSPTTDTSPVAANIAIGGSGGEAGDGELTTVTHTGDIVTDGRQSVGIMAQSVGGGGGNANLNVAGALNKKATALNLAVGGATDDGGEAGEVTVIHDGDIATAGDDSAAIFAQSVGGGGGSAALNMATAFGTSNALDVGIGRTGGEGGSSGVVTVTAGGNLTTSGVRATAILAQSVGGGGGTSGATSVGVSSSSGEGTAARSSGANVSVGLVGGMGGVGGDATVTNTVGLVMTAGREAHGIQAQSVGGGGGTGGAATNIVFRETTSLRVGVGGMGGNGGIGGIVGVTNAATVATEGERAHGIYAQSIGGSGGNGGLAATLALQAGGAAANGNNSIAVAVGGDGGVGVAGGEVTVTNNGVVQSLGDGSVGIAAQSIGGGGGDGGMVLNGTISGQGRNNAMSLGIGGSAGMGGAGGVVSVTNDGVVMTSGDNGAGIRAQSIGGGGGNAGLVANIDLINDNRDQNKARTIAFNVGGSGGMGGRGRDVTVSNLIAADGVAAMIVTEGENAYGIQAQSIGGGGGNGSAVITGRKSAGGEATLASLNVGGNGDVGGTSGIVTVTNEALISTSGRNAYGVLAQSIGGGGGNGGMVLSLDGLIGSLNPFSVPGNPLEVPSDRMLSVGGRGGDGGNAGGVLINNSGQIVTSGSGAHGILAQSIGGGGGNAGVNEGENTYDELAGLVDMIIGGSETTGGLGGEVTVNHSGDITVMGDGAQAIKAESINGGGGSSETLFEGIAGVLGRDLLSDLPGVELLPPFRDEPSLETRVGGEQQTDTVAANVTINNTGTFGAFGNNAAGSGVLGIGGGGGTATVAVNLDASGVDGPDRIAAIDVTVDIGGIDGANNGGSEIDSAHAGDVQTAGLNSNGVAIQSIGGGGGRANYSFSGDGTLLGALDFQLGGTNGSSDSGGSVGHRQEGNILTTGDLSHGLLVSSIGGGGGSLALTLDLDSVAELPSAQSVDDVGSIARTTRAGRLDSTEIGLGSNGGTALNGNLVDVDYLGAVATSGNSSVGIVLQSIGAGGGEVRTVGAEALNVTLGGSGGASGDGGDVELLVRESVTTTGDRSHGIVLQSIGGGGGAVFTELEPNAVTLSADNAGDGGDVTGILLRDVITRGDEAHGLIAQSIGGGGGFVDGVFVGSAGGAGAGAEIDLELAGDTLAYGAGSSAVIAQSLGETGAGDIRISVAADRMIVGGNNGIGIELDGGAENLLINRGLIATMDGIDGLAISATTGNEVIDNTGRVVGNVDLGSGSNAMNNAVDALFESGGTVNLGGPGSALTSAGTLSPGGAGLGLETQLNGDFVQASSGLFAMELDFANNAMDALAATGTVAVAGDIVLDRLNTQLVRPGDFLRPVFQADNGFSNNGVSFEFAPSVVVPTRFVESDNTLTLEYSVNFAPAELSRNRGSIGGYFNRLQTAGSSLGLADTIVELVSIGDLAAYDDALTQLSADMYAEQLAQTLTLSQEFLRSVSERCGAGDAYGRSQGDNCAWLRYDVKDMDRDADSGFPAFSGDSRRFSAGLQHKLDNGDVFGVGVAFDDTDFAGFDDRWTTNGRSWQFSASRDFAVGETIKIYLQGSVGESLYDTRRTLDVTESFTADSERDVFFVNTLLGIKKHWQAAGLRIRPGIDLGSTYLRADAFSETGALDQSLLVKGQSTNHLWLTPSLEVVGGQSLMNGVLLEGFGRIGVNHYLDDPNTRTRATLSGTIGGIGDFQALSDLDRTHGIFSVGLRAVSDKLRFSLTYDHDQSANRRTSGINGKLVFAW